MAYNLDIFNDLIGETCYLCTVRFAMTQTLQSSRYDDGRDFYCPNGHKQSYQETKEQRLQTELDLKQAKADRYERWYENEKKETHRIARSAIALRGHITRLKRA